MRLSIRRHVKRGRDTKIPQSSGPPIKVGNEAIHKELGDRIERAATTTSSLEAEQDSGNINPWQHLMDQVLRELVQVVVLVNAVRHYLVLPVQVPATEGAFINTAI
ncbi:hypothetical protein Tco_0213712 [Tanacetum coccineum]